MTAIIFPVPPFYIICLMSFVAALGAVPAIALAGNPMHRAPVMVVCTAVMFSIISVFTIKLYREWLMVKMATVPSYEAMA